MDYFDIDVYSRTVTTKSGQAQLWFNRGLTWCYAYGHEEAVRCFGRAVDADPRCAMAYWGIAYASGPNYNMPWDLFDPESKKAALETAFDASQSALALVNDLTGPERALIEALAHRYPQKTPVEDPTAWNDNFADAMREAFQAFQDDLRQQGSPTKRYLKSATLASGVASDQWDRFVDLHSHPFGRDR